jgi:uncharacterized protein YbbC (DUF1343 family)
MTVIRVYILVLGILIFNGFHACSQPRPVVTRVLEEKDIRNGAARFEAYLPALQGKRVGLVGNQTSSIFGTHLADTLLSLKVNLVKLFSPEHGFRGKIAAGEYIADDRDVRTGLPLISLYGKNKKPGAAQLNDIDVLLFDLQDVGVRFYTYISSLHYIMEACVENGITLIVLDRPNPNGFYVDGPVLEKGFESFVGMHPVPVVHGMTIGEYALMINGEGWLKDSAICKLAVIAVEGYSHPYRYLLPVSPSPNLNSMEAVYLYPSLCFFEGTVMSMGRGTDKPFRIYGHPKMEPTGFTFTPRAGNSAGNNPVLNGQLCHGYDLSDFAESIIIKRQQLYLFWLLDSYRQLGSQLKFFNDFFNKLAGNASLQQQIKDGWDEARIRKSWEPKLKEFKSIRKKYLLYPDLAG